MKIFVLECVCCKDENIRRVLRMEELRLNNEFESLLNDKECVIKNIRDKIILYNCKQIYPEDHIEIKKANVNNKYDVLDVHRDEKKLVIEADIETAIIYAAVLYKKAYDPMDESKRKYICTYAEKNKFDEVICSIRLWFSDDIYSIGIEDIKKISILNNNENIDVKFGGKYIVKNVSKISGYIVFYNYCEQLRNIKLFYEKIKANFKSDIEFHKIAKVYIL